MAPPPSEATPSKQQKRRISSLEETIDQVRKEEDEKSRARYRRFLREKRDAVLQQAWSAPMATHQRQDMVILKDPIPASVEKVIRFKSSEVSLPKSKLGLCVPVQRSIHTPDQEDLRYVPYLEDDTIEGQAKLEHLLKTSYDTKSRVEMIQYGIVAFQESNEFLAKKIIERLQDDGTDTGPAINQST